MKIVDFSLRNRTTVLFAMILVIAGGIYAYFESGKLEDPEFTVKTALIVTPYPGASPHEVEQQVTRVIEEAVQLHAEVETIRSESRAGVSMVYVDLYPHNWTKVIQQQWDGVRRKVQEFQGRLPQGAGPSIVYDDYSEIYGIFLAVTGEGFSYAELKEYADVFQRELSLVPDVARVDLYGTRTECIELEISRAKCAALGIPVGRIAQIINSQNQVVDAGAMEVSDRRLRIRASGVFGTDNHIGELVITQSGDELILLKDLATITRTYVHPSETTMRFNGSMAIGLGISARAGANVVVMGDAVKARMNALLAEMPLGIALEGVYYQSEFVKGAVNKFMINLLESVGIVVAVLLVFMGLRSGVIIASNLILSILATMVVMFALGIDLQRISLSALILVMGMIVDNAIVVTDGALVNIQKGESPLEAVGAPARQTAYPLLGATVIACLAFAPIFMAKDNTGEYTRSLFQVVSIALMLSWLLAMTQTPVFCLKMLKPPKKGSTKVPHNSFIHRIYGKLLDFSLRHRPFTLVVMVGLLATGIIGFGKVPQIFFADSDKAQFFIDYRLPEGTPIEEVSKDLNLVDKHLATFPQIQNYTTCIGQGPPRFGASITPEPPTACFGQVIINVSDHKEIDSLIKDLEGWFAVNLPQGEPHMTKYISGPKADYRVEARFSGPDPMVLRQLADQAKAVMRADPHSKNVCDDWRERVLTLDMAYAQRKARPAGVERSDLAAALLSQTDGLPVTAYREKDDLIPVKVAYSPDRSLSLEGLPVWGASPASVPLGQVVSSHHLIWEDPIVRRYDRRRVIRAQCDPVAGVTSDALLKRIRGDVEAIPLPTGYTLEWEGEYELSQEANANVQKGVPLALLGMVFILVALFNAFRQPLIIALTIPLATVGMAAGLLLCNQPFGFLAMLGAYSLIGMMIKNAVVLLDQIEVEKQKGKDPLTAVRDSSLSRMRPVMMAAITTVLGMIPLLTDAMFVSMAVTIMFGLAFATLLTLICVPVLYTVFFRVQTRV